jgi:hypothetical protein
MSRLWGLFGKRDKSRPFVPGQHEPKEYIEYVARLVWLQNQDQLGCVVVIVGLDDSGRVSAVLRQQEQLGLRCVSAEPGPGFKQRNPVIELRYRTGTETSAIVEDMRKLLEQGATDVSTVAIDTGTALKLKDMLGEKRCPFLWTRGG